MANITRRDFLKSAAVVGGALAINPAGLLAETDTTVVPAEMCIARWQSPPVVDAELGPVAVRLTEQAVASIGGMERFVGKGDVVWIKPNIGWNRGPELAATTNPDVVATLVRLAFDAGARKVKVGDNTCHDPRQAYASSGIGAAVKAVGGDVVYLDESRFRMMRIGGERLEEWEVYPEIVESDLVINVPIVKHHSLSRVTLCMKNYMGVIGGNRGAWHQDVASCLVDMTRFMKPKICVLDATRLLTNHGPVGGNPADVRRMDTVAAGTDIVALDAFGATLLGHKPESVETVRAGFEARLGEIDFQQTNLKEVALS